jgi:hypothetical protein
MAFMGVLLKILGFVPSIIDLVEKLLGPKTGTAKQETAVSLVGNLVTATNTISGKDIVDPNMFQEGLKMVIDGTVKMLNASVWHKPS